MPSQSEVSTRFSADNSQFRSVMNETIQVSDKGAKSILKKLDIKAGVGLIAAAIGLNLQSISEGIARLAIGFSKDAEEKLKNMVDQTEKAADEQEKALEKLRAKKLKEAEEDSDRQAKQYQLLRDARIKALEEEADAEKKIRQERYDAQQKQDEEHLNTIKDNLDLLTLEAKAKRGLTEDENKQLQLLRLKVKEQQRIAEITTLLSLNKRTPEEEARLQLLIRQKDVIESQVAAVNAVKEETKAIAPVIETNITAWEKFKSAINTTGRGDRELSDRELERKIDTIQQDISKRKQATAMGGYDFFLEPQKNNLRQAIAERDLRDRVRQETAAFGANRAFAFNSGLTESRFNEINRGLSPQETLTKQLDELRIKQQKGLEAIAAAIQSLQPKSA